MMFLEILVNYPKWHLFVYEAKAIMDLIVDWICQVLILLKTLSPIKFLTFLCIETYKNTK